MDRFGFSVALAIREEVLNDSTGDHAKGRGATRTPGRCNAPAPLRRYGTRASALIAAQDS